MKQVDLDRIDYVRLDYYRMAHLERYRRRVEREGLSCQECHGWGGWKEPVLDDGSGPWSDCGWCRGTGLVDKRDAAREKTPSKTGTA